MGRKFFGIACDHDAVHCWTDFRHKRLTKQTRDRRDIPRGEVGWVPFACCQSIPQAPKMQDSTECGIEMTISMIKRISHAEFDSIPGADPFKR